MRNHACTLHGRRIPYQPLAGRIVNERRDPVVIVVHLPEDAIFADACDDYLLARAVARAGDALVTNDKRSRLSLNCRMNGSPCETIIYPTDRLTNADMVADNLVEYNETDASTRVLFDNSKFPTARFMSFQEFVEGCYFGEGTPPRSGYVFMQPVVKRAFLECHQLSNDPLTRNGEDFLFYLDCFAAGADWLVTPEAMDQ